MTFLSSSVIAKTQRGVSLIEVLVVLIILGLVSTIAINGGSNAMLMKQKLQNAAEKSFNDSMANRWFRSTLESAFPLPESPPTFTLAKMEFLTQSPLLSEHTMATVSWSLTVDGRYVILTYKEGDQKMEVKRWFDAEASFEFEYEDKEDVIPSLISLEVNYLAPFGRQNELVLVSHSGQSSYPTDFRSLRN